MTESKSTRKPNADGVRTLPASVSLPESLIRIAERISARGCRLFAVGGLVRNTLLGLPVSDIDICSALTPDETIELAHEMGFKVVPKGIAFGMVEIHADGQKFEHFPCRQILRRRRAPPDEHTVFKNTRGGFAAARLFGKCTVLRYSDA